MGHQEPTPRWWKAPWRFFVETLTGFFIFAVIGGAAVGLDFLGRYLEEWQVDQLIVLGLKGAVYALFIMNLVLFGRFLWRTARRTWEAL